MVAFNGYVGSELPLWTMGVSQVRFEFITVPGSVLQSDLSAVSKLVYGALVSLSRMPSPGPDDWRASVRSLAEATGHSETAIKSALKALQAAGLIRASRHSRGANTYSLVDSAWSENDQGVVGKRLLSGSENDHLKDNIKNNKYISPDLVERIYKCYPRKVGKGAALKAIGKAVGDLLASGRFESAEDAAGWLVERVRLFASSAAGRAGRFCPHPSTWFNQARFDDDDSEWSVQQSGAGEVVAPSGKYDRFCQGGAA